MATAKKALPKKSVLKKTVAKKTTSKKVTVKTSVESKIEESDFSTMLFTVSGRGGFALSRALRLWKTKFSEFKDFEKEVIVHSSLASFSDFVKEIWEDIFPYTAADAFKVVNAEDRRIYFDCIGAEKLILSLEPRLLDRKVIKKKRARWDKKDTQYEYEFEDVYELYTISGNKLFGSSSWSSEVYVVKCKCTTTGREYYLYVPRESTRDRSGRYDAIQAIAWTIRLDITQPERIYRQGDIIVVKHSPTSKQTNQYHLNKDQYLSLMYSET